MKAPKLEGPKIIGRIELPVNAPNAKPDRGEKRNRKRIPVQKKPETNRSGGSGGGVGRPLPGGGTGGQNRGGGSGGGGGDRNRGGGGGQNHRANKRGPRRNDRNAPATQQQQEIDAKAIQDKIKQTQAKLAGNTRGKNMKSKYRRTKRDEMAEKEPQKNMLMVTQFKLPSLSL